MKLGTTSRYIQFIISTLVYMSQMKDDSITAVTVIGSYGLK